MLAAQVTHAAGESSSRVPVGTYAVVLSAPLEELQETEEKLKRLAVPHTVIVEHDGEYSGQITAIGVEPQRRSKIRKHFSSLPLLK